MFMKSILTKMCLRAQCIPTIDGVVCKLFQVWFGIPYNPFYSRRPHNIDSIFQDVYKLPFPPTHYYSPLPDVAGVKDRLRRWYRESEFRGISWDLPKQIGLLSRLGEYASELELLPAFAEVSQQGYGPGYGEVEAQILYLMLRLFKPTQVIEVGSGVSTFFALSALEANRKTNSSHARLTCVDPYPSDKLRELCQRSRVELVDSEVQDVPVSRFCQLGSNDLLFIDSSHVSKKDSDVDYLFLEVLPQIAVGVLIHVHDISFPMPAIPPAHPLFDHYLFWNEDALVKAFLLFNSAFEPILCESFLHFKAPNELKKIVPQYDPAIHFPSSLWLQRTK